MMTIKTTFLKVVATGWILLCCNNTFSQSYPAVWTSKGPGGGGAIMAASISPFNENEFFLTCDMSNMFHTTNFGQTYSMIPFTQLQVQNQSKIQFTSNAKKLYVLNRPGGYVPSKSYDGGANWTPAFNPCFGSAFRLFSSPHDTVQVVVSDRTKIYFTNTENSGGYAPVLTYSLPYGAHLAGVFFENKDTIFVCSHDALIYTFDRGKTWSNTLSGLNGIPSGEHIISFEGAKEGDRWVFYCVTIQANSLLNIYNSVAEDYTKYKGIYKLSQGQNQWSSLGSNLPNPSSDKGYLLGLAKNDTSTVYVGGSAISTSVRLGTIFKSTDGGNSFSNVFITSAMLSSNANVTTGWIGKQLIPTSRFKWHSITFIASLAVDPNNSSRIICGDQYVAHTSIDKGANWQQAYTDTNFDNAPSTSINQSHWYKTAGLETTASYWLDWTSPTDIFACYNDILARRSTDGGQSWSYDIYGLDSVGGSINDINMTLVNPANGLMYAAAGEQPGSNDNYTDERMKEFRGRISVSSDSGKNWSTLFSFTGHAVISIAFDKNPSATGMYAAVADVLGGIGDIYHCSDIIKNPYSWTRLSSPPRTEGRPIQIVVLNTDTLVAVYGARDGGTAFTASSGVFYSTNRGMSWVDRSDPKMFFETVNVEIDRNDPTQNTWLAFVADKFEPLNAAAPGVYRTTDRGINWTYVYNQASLSGTFHPAVSNELYICTKAKGLLYAKNTNSNSFLINSVSSYPFRAPQKVFFNPYDLNEVWVASFGNGFRIGRTNNVTGVNYVKGINKGFSLYPNPTSGQLNFSETLYNIEVLNVYGQRVLPIILSSDNISVSELSDGIYFIISKNTARKFIIKN
jgi:photosystem II stability/assembly factor-like uncharacterized protein